MRVIQKVIIAIYGILVALACIFVPCVLHEKLRLTEKAYDFYQTLPLYYHYSPFWRTSLTCNIGTHKAWPPLYYTFIRTIDYRQIVLTLVAITAIFGVLFVLTLRLKQKGE